MAKFFLKNPGFELGDQDWQKIAGPTIINDAINSRSGVWVAKFEGTVNATLRSAAIGIAGFLCRPGGKMSISVFINSAAATAGNANARLSFRDKDNIEIANDTSPPIAFGSAGYVQAVLTDSVVPDRTKSVSFELLWQSSPAGTWFVDDFVTSGDIIETIPATAKIQSHTMLLSRTTGVFDPLIGADKHTEFNAGMSDKWAGMFTFIPLLPSDDLGELLSFLERLGRIERFFAFDPDRLVPKNGVVNNMTVDGPITNGTNKISVKAGPVSSIALVAGDYIEVKDQYFQLQRDLEIGPEGTGEAIVVPAVRSTLADGEDIITDNPKMIARVTSDVPRRSGHDKWTQLSVSWEEV